MNDIWQFQQSLTRRLSLGAGVSLLLALGMALLRTPFWNGVAVQFAAWALIDLLIAWGGAAGTRKRRARLTMEEAAAAAPVETRNLARLLWINTALDVIYMLAGVLVAVLPGRTNPLWLGTGVGIFFQGAFLFFFDWVHALQTRKL